MIDNIERRGFIPDQFVVVNREEDSHDIGYILRPLPGDFYEINLFSGHKVDKGADPVFVFSYESLRSATVEEVLARKREWEVINNHELPFTINTIFEGVNLIGLPEGQTA